MSRLSVLVLFAAALGAGGAARAATVDFTDPSMFSDGDTTETIMSGGVSVDVTISGVGGGVNFTPYDGPAPAPADLAGSGLFAGDDPSAANDGFGIMPSDEIANGDEAAIVEFSSPVTLTAFHFLDLYQDPDGPEQETAIVFLDGSTTPSFTFMAEDEFQLDAGYLFAPIDPVTAMTVRFVAGEENDGQAEPDFALAGIDFDVAPIPLPASSWLLLSAVVGAGWLARRRRRDGS